MGDAFTAEQQEAQTTQTQTLDVMQHLRKHDEELQNIQEQLNHLLRNASTMPFKIQQKQANDIKKELQEEWRELMKNGGTLHRVPNAKTLREMYAFNKILKDALAKSQGKTLDESLETDALYYLNWWLKFKLDEKKIHPSTQYKVEGKFYDWINNSDWYHWGYPWRLKPEEQDDLLVKQIAYQAAMEQGPAYNWKDPQNRLFFQLPENFIESRDITEYMIPRLKAAWKRAVMHKNEATDENGFLTDENGDLKRDKKGNPLKPHKVVTYEDSDVHIWGAPCAANACSNPFFLDLTI